MVYYFTNNGKKNEIELVFVLYWNNDAAKVQEDLFQQKFHIKNLGDQMQK